MTIADEPEKPKPAKKLAKSLDAIAALRIAMEQRLAEVQREETKIVPPPSSAATIVPAIEPVSEQQKSTLHRHARESGHPVSVDTEKNKRDSRLRGSDEPKDGSQKPEHKSYDPSDWPRILMHIAERSQKLIQDYMQRNQGKPVTAPVFSVFDPAHLTKAFIDLTNRIIHDPERFANAQINLWQGYIKIWQSALARSQGKATEPVIAPSPADKRFKDEEWQNNWVFDYIKQSYLLTAQWIHNLVQQESAKLDPKEARKLEFYTRQMVDAISPSNFWLTNPQVLRTTFETGGENLVKGLENLLADLERGHGQLRISMSDLQAFEVGKNLATTPGKVIYQNHLMQLIQYAPQTPTVHAVPLLIIPPWINKYYILDLKEKNSYIGYLVKQGYTVFVISWVNPDKRHATVNFDDYMVDGALEAMRQIKAATGEENLNVVGYCIGGTLLASTLAYLQAVSQQESTNSSPLEGEARWGVSSEQTESNSFGEHPPSNSPLKRGRTISFSNNLPTIKSATYLVTLTDFSEPGDLGVFIDDAQVTAIEEHMSQQGYLEAASMATTFNLLRANDLIWSFVINNYLLGKEPFPFDILYWNGDSTNLPAKMQSFYLREMYLNNKLIEPNGLQMKNVPIDLRRIDTPSFMLSTRDDHIAPWRTTYAATQIYRGPVKFVLSGSGHIAGIVNPPSAEKYGYWTNDTLPQDAEDWFKNAQSHNGSWWPEWLKWLAPYSGDQIPAREITGGIEDAPGSYVKVMAV